MDTVAQFAKQSAQLLLELRIHRGSDEVWRVEQQTDAAGGKRREDLFGQFDRSEHVRKVGFKRDAAIDGLEDREDKLANGSLDLRNGLRTMVARIRATE